MAATFSGKRASEAAASPPTWRNFTQKLASFWWNGIFCGMPLLGWA